MLLAAACAYHLLVLMHNLVSFELASGTKGLLTIVRDCPSDVQAGTPAEEILT